MAFIPPTKIVFSGNHSACQEHIKFAVNQLAILERQMSFQNLNEGVRRISPYRGVFVECISSFSKHEVRIFVAPINKEQKVIDKVIIKSQDKELNKKIKLFLAFYYRWYDEYDNVQFDPLSYSEIILTKVDTTDIDFIEWDSKPLNPFDINGLKVILFYVWAYEIVTDPHGNYFDITGSDGNYNYKTASQTVTYPSAYDPPEDITVCANESVGYSATFGYNYADVELPPLTVLTDNNYSGLIVAVDLCGVHPNLSGYSTRTQATWYEALGLSGFDLEFTTSCDFYWVTSLYYNRLFHAEGSRSIGSVGRIKINTASIIGEHSYSLSYGAIVLGDWSGAYTSGLITYYPNTYKITHSGIVSDITPGVPAPESCKDIPASYWFGGYLHFPREEQITYVTSSSVAEFMPGVEAKGSWTWTPTYSRMLKGFNNDNKMLACTSNICTSYYKDFTLAVGAEELFLGHNAGEGPYWDFSVMVVGDREDILDTVVQTEYKFFVEIDGVSEEHTIPELFTVTAKNETWSQTGNRIANFTISTNNIGFTYSYVVVEPGPDVTTTGSLIVPFNPYLYRDTEPVTRPSYIDDNSYWPPYLVHNTDKIIKRVVGFIYTGEDAILDNGGLSNITYKDSDLEPPFNGVLIKKGDRFEVEINNNEEDLAQASFVGDLIFWEKVVTVADKEVIVPVSAMVLSDNNDKALLNIFL